MALSWSGRRKFLYASVVGVIGLVMLLVLWQVFFSAPAQCFDQKKNGDETGVDCGGSCSLICAGSARAPVVLWARSFLTAQNTYTLAAYIQNSNIGSGARKVDYVFQLYDDKNSLIIERRGALDLPPVQTIPIVETNVNVGNRVVAHTAFSFTETPVWHRVYADDIVPIIVTKQNLNADGSRVSATLANDSLRDAKNITVMAVLFDHSGTARAASKTFVARVPQKSSKDIVFTWPNGIQDIVQTTVSVLPSF